VQTFDLCVKSDTFPLPVFSTSLPVHTRRACAFHTSSYTVVIRGRTVFLVLGRAERTANRPNNWYACVVVPQLIERGLFFCQCDHLQYTKASSGIVVKMNSCHSVQLGCPRACHNRSPPPSTLLKRDDDTTKRRHDDTTTRRHDDTLIRRHDDTTARRHDDTPTCGKTARRHDGTTSGQPADTTK
jgi:hypothetical protein